MTAVVNPTATAASGENTTATATLTTANLTATETAASLIAKLAPPPGVVPRPPPPPEPHVEVDIEICTEFSSAPNPNDPTFRQALIESFAASMNVDSSAVNLTQIIAGCPSDTGSFVQSQSASRQQTGLDIGAAILVDTSSDQQTPLVKQLSGGDAIGSSSGGSTAAAELVAGIGDALVLHNITTTSVAVEQVTVMTAGPTPSPPVRLAAMHLAKASDEMAAKTQKPMPIDGPSPDAADPLAKARDETAAGSARAAAATPPPTRHWTTEWFRKVDLRRRGRVLVTDEMGTDGEVAVATQAAAERRIHALESKWKEPMTD